jgi:hypothetical protein
MDENRLPDILLITNRRDAGEEKDKRQDGEINLIEDETALVRGRGGQEDEKCEAWAITVNSRCFAQLR